MAEFIVKDDRLIVPAWEWDFDLPPVGVRQDVMCTLYGQPVRVRRGYEDESPVGIGLGFTNGWWVCLHGLTDDCAFARVMAGACPSDRDGDPSMWTVRADVVTGGPWRVLQLIERVMARAGE
jgi:hypothetical protein